MGRRFITAHDVDDLAASGDRELRLDAGTRLTDLARERARDHGIAIVEAGAAPTTAAASDTRPAPPAPRSDAGSTPSREQAPAATTSTGGDAGTPRRQLRAAVRQGVIEEFGGAPGGLDAAIGRVFDRLGIRD